MDSRSSAPLTLAARNRFDPAASLAARGDVARTQRAPLRPTIRIGRCTRDMRSAARGGHDGERLEHARWMNTERLSCDADGRVNILGGKAALIRVLGSTRG